MKKLLTVFLILDLIISIEAPGQEKTAFSRYLDLSKKISLYPYSTGLWLKDWETKMDSVEKMKHVARYMGPGEFAFQDELDLYDGDYIPVYAGAVHFLDLNNNGEYFIIHQENFGYRGTKVRFYYKNGQDYLRSITSDGKVSSIQKITDGHIVAVQNSGCCDSYVHFYDMYLFNKSGIKLVERHALFQSNLKRLDNLPQEVFDKPTVHKLEKSTTLYYRDHEPVHNRLEAPDSLVVKYRLFHPFLVFSKGTYVKKLAKDDKTEEGQTFYFVEVQKNARPVHFIRNIYGMNVNNREVANTYYGWVNDADLN